MTEKRPLRVLIVEADIAILVALDKILSAAGCEGTDRATCGYTALRLSARVPPDVAIVNYSLPEGSGLAVAEGLKVLDARIFVILLSTHPLGASVLSDVAVDQFLLKSDINRLPTMIEVVARDRGLLLS